MADPPSLYDEAQILIAGVRLFQHREQRMPATREVAEFIRFSVESVYHLSNRLEKIGVLEIVRGAFEERICLKEPWKAELLREEQSGPEIAEDIRQWQEQHQGVNDMPEFFLKIAGKRVVVRPAFVEPAYARVEPAHLQCRRDMVIQAGIPE